MTPERIAELRGAAQLLAGRIAERPSRLCAAEYAEMLDEIERLTAELTTTKANIRAALGGIGLLPKDPDDLLTTEQRREMDRDLQRMARQRRRVEAESAGLVLP